MRDIVILGAGGFARELHQWCKDTGVNVRHFFTEKKKESEINGITVIDNLFLYDGFYYLCGVGDPELKKKLSDLAESKGLIPSPPLIHPKTTIGEFNTLEPGVIVCPGTIITVNCHIRKNVMINIGCTIGHDTMIGSYTTLSPGANISGNVEIGEKCYIGTNSSIREKIKIGTGAVVGMGAIIVKHCKEYKTYIGIAAKEKQ